MIVNAEADGAESARLPVRVDPTTGAAFGNDSDMTGSSGVTGAEPDV